ncbi:hypothetical protein DMR_14680 [Solidesulfovibrio magneticus RS-1]|uniref:Uncharacterized protein n=1 Tax=Solidesulfovibrio magneticus (strain ATCC 700980 / DSM 13731 / RS-1) TaxID=573370 RepID=C4XNI4_SOLM1|nr:hypothetical protein DMR_14680 [Solidesulfovibrio magneticus RS-1]
MHSNHFLTAENQPAGKGKKPNSPDGTIFDPSPAPRDWRRGWRFAAHPSIHFPGALRAEPPNQMSIRREAHPAGYGRPGCHARNCPARNGRAWRSGGAGAPRLTGLRSGGFGPPSPFPDGGFPAGHGRIECHP